MLAVEFIRRTKIDGDSMLNDAVLFQNRIEHFKGSTAIDHEVLRDDFKPIYNRFLLQDVPVVRDAQADPDSVICVSIERVCGHGSWESPGSQPQALRSFLVGYLGLLPSVAQPPLPLQVFLPLQPWSPDLQPPWPLQAFVPLQACSL